MNNGQQHMMNNQQQRRSNNNNAAPFNPLKPVYKLLCRYCHNMVCARGMRAILLADTNIELYSTDIPATSYDLSFSLLLVSITHIIHCSIQLMDKDYLTRTCHCRIRDVACREW